MENMLLKLYYSMKRIRMVENYIADHYNGEVREMRTPIHLCDGQEGMAAGVCGNLHRQDTVFGNHRSHGHYLAKGGDLKKMVAELHNRETGCCRGRGGSMHLIDRENGVALTSSIVAGNVSIAVGYALAQKMKKTDTISVVFFGDGASEEGSVYESICYAKINRLPVLFVCENNLYSISTPFCVREPNADIGSKFETILPVASVDGNDVLTVYEKTREITEHIRNGEGPWFLECKTYRYRNHHNTGNGVDNRFRTTEELDLWKAKCPIMKLERKLSAEGLLENAEIERIEDEIQKEIEAAFSYAKESACPDAGTLCEGVWS